VHATALGAVLMLQWWGVNLETVVFSGQTHVVPMTVELQVAATQLPVPARSVEALVARQAASVLKRLEPDVDVTNRLTGDASRPAAKIRVPFPEVERPAKPQPAVARPAVDPPSPAKSLADHVSSRPASATRQVQRSPARVEPQPEPAGPQEKPSPKPALSQPRRVGTEDRTRPDLTGNRPPPYPARAYRAGIEGALLLRITISRHGEVQRVDVVRSSGHPMLDTAAVQTIRTWHAIPARAGGRAVACVELLPVQFRLRPPAGSR